MKKDKIFIRLAVAIPVLNILMDIGMNFFPTIKTPIGIVRIIFLILVTFLMIKFYGFKKNNVNRLLIFYVLFILTTSIFASDLKESLIDGVVKISISLFMIPVGFQLSKLKNNALVKPMIWVIILLLLNYIASQFFKLGVSIYDEDSFYTGGATASAPIIIALGLLVIFNAFNLKNLPYKKIVILIITISALFVVLISLKRGAILALFLSAIVYLFYSQKKVSSTFILGLSAVSIVFLIFQFSDTLSDRIESRTTERNEIQNESRYKETFYVIDEMQESNFLQVLFGKEAFNSGVLMEKYFGRPRQLHVDYNLLLSGTGIFGLFLYLYLYWVIFIKSKKYRKKISISNDKNKRFKGNELYALIISVIVLSLIMSFSGGLQFVSYRVMLFLVLGYFLGQMQRVVLIKKIE